MKIPVIKHAVENYSLEQLQKAEEAIYEEKAPEINIEGSDTGEQLTHILAAIFIKNEMQNSACDLNTALRKYTQKVRSSIN